MTHEEKMRLECERAIEDINNRVKLTCFVKNGRLVGNYLRVMAGPFTPVKLIFHLNLDDTPSDQPETYIREVVYVPHKVSGESDMKAACEALIWRINPKMMEWGAEIVPDMDGRLSPLSILSAVERLGCSVIHAL